VKQVEGARIWMDGALVPGHEARIHVLTHALHYGTAVLEDTNAYLTPDGPAIFRLDAHLERLYRSARMIGLRIPYDFDELHEATVMTVVANGHSSCHIRHLVYRGHGGMGLLARDCPVSVTIATWEWPEPTADGVRLMTSPWRRNDPAAVPVLARASGAQLTAALARAEAAEAGFDEAVLLDAGGNVTGCTGADLFLVADGALVTPPHTAGGHADVVRDTVERLASDLGIPVRRREIVRAELYTADELFLCDATAGIVWVASVDNREVVGGEGPVTKTVKHAFDDVVHGRDARYSDWLTLIM